MRKPALHKLREKARFSAFYFASFLAALHFYFVVYINSSFLKTYVGEELVGVFYVIGSSLSILLFLLVSRMLAKLGNYRALIIFTAVEALALLGIALISAKEIAPLIFVVHLAVAPLIFYSLDVFLEGSLKSEESTGRVRGTFLTALTLAFVCAPLAVGALLETHGFPSVYIISGALLIPFIALIALQFRRFIDPAYHTLSPKTLLPVLKELWANTDVKNIIFAHLIMRLYMAWMAVYLPIYLHDHIGFSWSEIGLILVIIFLPYFVEFPLGKIADTKLGEKELLIAGFIIMAGSIALIPALTTAHFLLWVIVLFISRLGCAFAEIMTESYFFKHIDGEDTELLSFFRLLRPMSYLLAISIAIVTLSFVDIRFSFLVLAALMLLGVRYGFGIRDTL